MSQGIERRDFLKVLGTAGTGATLFGCSSTPEKLIPYVVPAEEIVPGMATWYRTTCRECPAGCGMNLRTREGRAVKAEGNPLSPISHGRLCARGQSALHGLYDPDRIPQALEREGTGWKKVTWDAAEQRLAAALAQNRGRTVFLTHSFTGTLDALVDEWCASLGITRVRYETFAYEPVRAAHRLLFGLDAVPTHDFSNAEVVVTFGADFLETWVSPIDYAYGFVQGHAYQGGRRGRLISVTPHQSLTDMNADDWLPAKPGTEHLVALAMARIITDEGRGAAGAAAALIASTDPQAAATQAGVPVERIRQAALAFANGGRSVAVGPGVSSQHGAATAVAAAVAILNSVAGNYGRTVHVGRAEEHTRGTATYRDVQQLVQRMAAGQVGALLVYGPNPAYTMPASDSVAAALGRVPFIASFWPYLDDTSSHAHLLLPDHHFLESWNDYVPRAGVVSMVQPVMMPVFSTKQTGDVLISVARQAGAALSSPATTYYDYLRERWQRTIYPQAAGAGAFDDWWREALQTGGVTMAAPPAAPAPSGAAAGGLGQIRFDAAQFAGTGDYTLVVYPSLRFFDGRTANRPWLQELPDPVSKLTWTSWVELNPHTAEQLGLDDGHVVELTSGSVKVELPVFRHPGMRPDVVAIQLGQGHRAFGRYAANRDRGGVNPLDLLGSVVDAQSGALCYTQTKVSLRPTGEWQKMPQAGGIQTEGGRHIVATMDLVEARSKDGGAGYVVLPGSADAAQAHGPAAEEDHTAQYFTNPKDKVIEQLQGTGGFTPDTVHAGPAGYPPPETYYGEYSEAQPRWAMSIDLERCIGCGACVTACQSENNIGIVGPELVAQGRTLHWMRIERYWEEPHAGGNEAHAAEGEEVTGGVKFLPMLCQQCGNAPCEPVCPVYAAYHTPEGLNAQVYNRCVGTRYCANNCPYKVRVFNWYTYEWPEPLNWQLNPDVTVREKGVMEKCTFCVQRIRDAQNVARLEDRGVQDGEIVPACAQTCPGEAIVFGNIKDSSSRVARIAASGRGYRVLEELNTQSAITYLKKVNG
jgi:anaerobic selenocysteine-containing dehydrogenase/Fe-S-cluster-containing dehydrogenase component